jgi:transposase
MNRVEVITSVERCRRWSSSDKARLVAAMEEPGAIVTEVARKAGVDPSLLYRWRRQLGGRARPPTFVPVRVAEEPEGACAPAPARATITIAFGAQVRLTIESAPDAATLSTVMGALAARGWQECRVSERRSRLAGDGPHRHAQRIRLARAACPGAA